MVVKKNVNKTIHENQNFTNSISFDRNGETVILNLERIGLTNLTANFTDQTINITSNLDMKGYNITNVNSLYTTDIFDLMHTHFNITAECENEEPGTLCYDVEADTLKLFTNTTQVIQLGREVSERGINREGSNVPNGAIVYLSGASGDNPEFKLADGSNVTKSSLIGVLTTDCNNGQACPVTVFGFVNDIDTSSWNVGDKLYMNSSSPGNFTNIIPVLPNNPEWVATVVRSHANQGRIFVSPKVDPSDGFLINNIYSTGDIHVDGLINSSSICLNSDSCITNWDEVNQSGGLWTNSSGDAIYTSGNVAIGTTSPDTTLYVEGNTTITGDENNSFTIINGRVDHTLNYSAVGSTDDDRVYEINGYVESSDNTTSFFPRAIVGTLTTRGNNDFGDGSGVTGFQGSVNVESTGYVNEVTGMFGRTLLNDKYGGGNVSTMIGLKGYSMFQHITGGSQEPGFVNNTIGLQAQVESQGSSVVVNSSVIKILDIDNSISTGGAVDVNNFYGLYMNNISGATNNYGVYINSTANNYFGGKMGIGTVPDDVFTLDVNGTIQGVGAIFVVEEGASAAFRLDTWSDKLANANIMNSYRSGGTEDAKTPVLDGMNMFEARVIGYYDSENFTRNAEFSAIATEDHNSTNKGVKWVWSGTSTGDVTKTDWMTLKDGDVGIGTSTPQVKLHAYEAIDGDIFRIQDNDGTCSQNPESGGITTTCSSDESLKTNITDINKTEVLEYLKVWSTCMKEYDIIASGDRMIGPIAQCVNETLPELVSEFDLIIGYENFTENVTFEVETFKKVTLNKTVDGEIVYYNETVFDKMINVTEERIVTSPIYETYLTVEQPDTNRLLIGAVELYKKVNELEIKADNAKNRLIALENFACNYNSSFC